MSNAAGQDKLADEIYQVLIGYKCAFTQIEGDGGPMPLVDLLSPGKTIAEGREECSELAAEIAEAVSRHNAALVKAVEGLKGVLSTHRYTLDTCTCDRCTESIKSAVVGKWVCETCGYAGRPLAVACQCYDMPCAGSGFNGSGCPHGCLTCPVCAEGEGDTNAWEIIKEMNAVLVEAEAAVKDRPRNTSRGSGGALNPGRDGSDYWGS